MAGWNLRNGKIRRIDVSESEIWSLFNFVFSDSSKKRNTYKFGLIKSILDNVFNAAECGLGFYISYYDLFSKFAENYWNLVIKYGLRQMRPDGKSDISKVEAILTEHPKDEVLQIVEFSSLDESLRRNLICKVEKECKTCVIGALYEDFNGLIYAFDLKDKGLILNRCFYDFILKYKFEIEKINYYSWAKFLEKVNDESALVKVIGKLELATPRRGNLAIYREILRREFEQNTCFYCGNKLRGIAHVDHFIPWSFVKDDKVWNFVLSCSKCNERKSDRLATRTFLDKLEIRNAVLKNSRELLVLEDFKSYSEGVLTKMWVYAKQCGFKEFAVNK